LRGGWRLAQLLAQALHGQQQLRVRILTLLQALA
jgi:hypothetical protein